MQQSANIQAADFCFIKQNSIDELFITQRSAVLNCGISDKTLRSAKHRKSKSWHIINDPTDRRANLIHYESLREKYKEKIRFFYGDPYQYMVSKIIYPLLISKTEDVELLQNYSKNNEYLLEEITEKYIHACKYLYLFERLTHKEIRELGYKSIKEDFYPAVVKLIKTDKSLPNQFPQNYSSIKRKLKEYKSQGAGCVIHGSIGNDHSRKVNEMQQAMIVELVSKANQFDAVQVATIYNNVANDNGWKNISSQTVVNQLRRIETDSFRNGEQPWRNKHDFVIQRSRPSAPNILWNGDATPYELLYQQQTQNKNHHAITKYWKRKVVYVVSDSFNDYITGFGIYDTENNELAKFTWKNACFSHNVLPQQIKVDNFGRKELKEFYERITIKPEYFTPSSVGNPRDKVIESQFARIYKFVTKFHSNASGHNIMAKNQPNREFLDKIKKTFPDESAVIDQIIFDIFIWNNAPRKKLGGKSLYQQWIEADHSNDRKLNEMQKFEVFGARHQYENTLTNRGIVIKIEGKEYVYMNFDDLNFYKTIGTRYQVIYDEDDMSKILVKADGGRQKFLLEQVHKQPMAFADATEGSRKSLNKKLEFKKLVREELVMKPKRERQKLLEENGLNEYLESPVLAQMLFNIDGNQKALNYAAQNILKGDFQKEECSEYMQKKNDTVSDDIVIGNEEDNEGMGEYG